MTNIDLSVVEYYGEQNRGICGYCKGSRSSFSHGMHAYAISTQDYQDLIDRGWRRSGEYCYKPNNKITCCPSYTIKCDSQEFKLSKSHKKVLKRMNKFLRDGIKEKKDKDDEKDSDIRVEEDSDAPKEIVNIPNIAKQEINVEDIANISKQVNATCDIALKRLKRNANDSKLKDDEKDTLNPNKEDIRKPCQKAKQLRLERKKAKLEAKGLTVDLGKNRSKNEEKTLSDFICNTSENDCHKLKIVLVSSEKGSTPQVLDLYKKYQVIIHKDPPYKITKFKFERFLCTTPLKLKLLECRSRECLSHLKETYALYEKYQTIIHNDPPQSLKEFLGFLQKSPLKHFKPENGPQEGYGSFHQQYWLDDKLIAVGVIDILPYCLSSVYFFYDPDYSFLSLGTYGSLREIFLVNQLCETTPSLKYYYMGFYIHSCPKMKYKGKLTASFLLCPEKYTWHLLTDEIRAKLDEKKYQVFNIDPNSRDEDEFTLNDLDAVLILFQRNSYATYLEFKQIKNRNYDKEILEYGGLVGKTCAQRMLFLTF